MLILTRLVGEAVIVGDAISITVCRIKGDEVQIGISAPTTLHPPSMNLSMHEGPRPEGRPNALSSPVGEHSTSLEHR